MFKKIIFSFFVYIQSLCLIANEGPLGDYVVGVESQSYAPYFYVEDGRYLGFSRELLDLFFDIENLKIEYKPYSISELFLALKSGDVDFRFPDSPLWKSPQKTGVKWYYSESVVPYIDGMLVNSFDLKRGVNSIRKMGAIKGFTPWGYHHLIQDDELGLVESDSVDGLVGLLLSNRVDAIYTNVPVAMHHLRMNRPASFTKVSFNPNLPYTRHQYLLSTIKHKTILDLFNKFLSEQYEAIYILKVKYGLHRMEKMLDRTSYDRK